MVSEKLISVIVFLLLINSFISLLDWSKTNLIFWVVLSLFKFTFFDRVSLIVLISSLSMLYFFSIISNVSPGEMVWLILLNLGSRLSIKWFIVFLKYN